MLKFLRVWFQDGGCDYTIGCGIRLETIEAADITAATDQTIIDIVDGKIEMGEGGMNRFEIYPIGPHVSVNASVWKTLVEAARERRRCEEQESKDRAEYERLKNKFGGQ